MLSSQSTPPDRARQDPFRWSRSEITAALGEFSNPDRPSQRCQAQQLGIPPATFNHWVRHYSHDPHDPVASFFCSSAGHSVLRRIVAAAITTFQLRGACGIRFIGDFLALAQLDPFVATSRGALQPLVAHLETNLVAFGDQEQLALAQPMRPRTITVVTDEHFHAGNPCLVAIEPVSNFILVETYRPDRTADTWKEVLVESTAGMPIEVVQMTSDQASALICCAEKGLQAAHSPDLFHGQHDLLKPILLPLLRPISQAQKDLEKAARITSQRDAPIEEPVAEQDFQVLLAAVIEEQEIVKRLEQAKETKEAAVEQVRGIGDDYHPFDRETGKAMSGEEVGKRLEAHVERLEQVVQKAGLGERARAAIEKSRTWLSILVGCVAWFWVQANRRMEKLELNAEQEQVMKEKLMAGHYWEQAGGRARTAEERTRLKKLAEELKKEAWQEGGALASLPEERRKELKQVARECAELFQRSRSCVEGRNGRLSLQQHGHSRVRARRLKALTVIHNYLVKRSDQTTAAERFFGHKHQNVFEWVLQRMPSLPRPAEKRKKSAQESLPVAG